MSRRRSNAWQRVRASLRDLVPDRLVARIRLHRYSREFRSNVDVLLPSRRGTRRWLRTTPDTYRVRIAPDPASRVPTMPGAPTWSHPAARQRDTDAALAALAEDPGRGAAVVGEARPTTVRGRRRTEPEVAPLVVALRPDVAAELSAPTTRGSDTTDQTDLVALVERARDAGQRIALLPRPWTGAIPSRRRDPITTPTTVVVLALVPLHDVGGGSRGAQLTRELVRRGVHVVYAPLFASLEPVDLGLRYVHPRLEQRPVRALDPASLTGRTAPGTDTLVLVEAPAPPLVEAGASLAASGARVVYDLIDDWGDPDLGGAWYDPEVERQLIDVADQLVASAPRLADELHARTGRRVELIPNGVDADLFVPDPPGPAPPDLPVGNGPLLGYHGSMYGAWLDWQQLRAVADARPDARVVLIGVPPDPPPPLPDNVHLLGLRAHADLPAYVARFDVGLVPFVVGATTHAISPLKVYEYLACGVPVAAPPLAGLDGLDGVHRDRCLPSAVEAALAASPPDAAAAGRAHGWQERVARLAAAAGVQLGPRGAPVTTRLRPPVRYARAGRRP